MNNNEIIYKLTGDSSENIIDGGNALFGDNEIVVTGNKNKVKNAITSPEENTAEVKDKQTTSATPNENTEVVDELFVKPLNPTDPIVYHDPSYKPLPIVDIRMTDERTSDDTTADLQAHIQRDQSTERVNGIYVPEVRLNNIKIEMSNIDYFYLSYTEFIPKLTILIKDPNAKIQKNDVPGLNNVIIVALVPRVQGIYKTIRLEFYIEEFNPIDQFSCVYHCKWKFIPFEKTYAKAIIYPGCSHSITKAISSNGQKTNINISCNQSCNITPNTWEFLHEIALETGLGFQATQKCNDIKDNRERIIQGEKYFDAIPKHVEFGGDASNIFDCWIDLYGYIVLVNLSYIFNSEYDYKHYTIYAMRGVDSTEAQVEKPNAIMTHRVITNNKSNANHSNLQFSEDKYTSVTDNYYIINEGAHTKYWYAQPYGIGEGINNIVTEELQIQEPSVDGMHINDYDFMKTEFIGFEMSETPMLMQKQRHKKYMQKLTSNILEIELDIPNLGLQRGTLVQVHIWDYSPEQKRKILTNDVNLYKEDMSIESINQPTDISGNTDLDEPIENIINNSSVGIPNMGLSGMYYINGMEFIYTRESESITQKLFLIRKGEKYNQNNKYNIPKALKP